MMNKKLILFAGIMALTLAACNSIAPTIAPAPQAVQSSAPSPQSSQPAIGKSNGAKLPTKSEEGGSVTVDVTPTTLEVGKPLAFDIAMNTHSVDLGDDLTKIATLRDDTGKEYKPTAWEGPDGGGHHRSGTLQFAALSNKPKYVELVIKGLAQVPERVFRWDLP
jgi:hypothetical protein